MQELRRDAMDVPVSLDDLMRVIALEGYHCKISLGSCTFSYISQDEADQARKRLTELRLRPWDLGTAVMKLPLPLHLCDILFKAKALGVGYEAAAIVALKHAGRWKYPVTFTVPEVVEAMSDKSSFHSKIIRFVKVKQLFRTLRHVMQLDRTHLSETYTAESLAVAFLTAPERLIWSIKQEGAFLGTPLVHHCTEDFFVAALFSKAHYKDLKCALYLPWSEWVQLQTGIQEPTKTNKQLGDSTLQMFRRDICQHLREVFSTDVRLWSCRGGASETTLAEELAKSLTTDTTVMCPNGNGLSACDQMRVPAWLAQNADDICGGLRVTSTSAVLFIGEEDLCPGVPHPDIYARLIQLYAVSFARLNVPVVTQAPGVLLQEDRIHWSASSTTAVLNLMTVLMQQLRNTDTFSCLPPVALWHWKYHEQPGKHFPVCNRCDKKITDEHLSSNDHEQRHGKNWASFAIQDRETLANHGVVFTGMDGKQITASPLPPDRPLLVMNAAEIEDPPVVNKVLHFEIMDSYTGSEVAKNTGLPKELWVKIIWND